jgi:Uma2 family endonuclease
MESASAKPDAPAWSPEVRRQLTEWLSQPREASAELVEGRIVRKAMATGDHGAAQGGVFSQLFKLQGNRGAGKRWWLTLEIDVYLGGEGMRPDVAGWRIERCPSPPQRVNVEGPLGVVVEPPDWVCEVLSTSTVSRDVGIKWKAYQRAGVEWYWLVDVVHESLTVYRRTEKSYEVIEMVCQGETARLPPFEEIDFQLGPLFAFKQLPDG